MGRPNWKTAESRFAAMFGVKRKSLSGALGSRAANNRDPANETASDSEHESLFLECKYKKSHSCWTLWRKVAHKAKLERKIPVIGLVEKSAKGILLVLHSANLETVALEYLSTLGYTCLKQHDDCEDDESENGHGEDL